MIRCLTWGSASKIMHFGMVLSIFGGTLTVLVEIQPIPLISVEKWYNGGIF